MKERTENPDQTIVDDCCKRCPLFPSKPSYSKVAQNVAAAADAASRLKKLVDGNIVQIVYSNPNELSAKRVAAYFGYLNAESESERKRFKKPTEKKNNVKFSKSDYF